MKYALLLFGLLALSPLLFAEKSYQLHLRIYQNDSAELLDSSVIQGSPGPFPDAGAGNNYEFRVYSATGEVLFTQPFYLGFVVYPDGGPNYTGPKTISKVGEENYYRLPYFDDGAVMKLFHEGKKIFEYQIPHEIQGEKPADNIFQGVLFLCAAAAATMAVLLAAFFLLRKKEGTSKKG
jgi:hypothetical protein